MTLVLTWDNHNRLAQADQAVAYDDGDTGREDGQQTVVEWRYRADPGDPWGAATIQTIDAPATTSYDPPAAGWVQITVYSIRDGLVSWQAHVGVVQVDGSGEIEYPQPYADEDDETYVDEASTEYED